MVFSKFNYNIKEEIIAKDLRYVTNQIYKLLPLREENEDWQKQLETVMLYLKGIQKLFDNCQDLFFPILCKLAGLETLTKEEDYPLYRKTVFECLGLLKEIQNGFFN